LGIKVRRSCFWRKRAEEDLQTDLHGKVALVSGANSGIGRATARGLAIRAAEVHMLCRSKERGTAALTQIKEDKDVNDASKVHLHIVDLSEPDQIRAFAADFKKKHQKLDILVNNAAVMPNELRTNSKGMEVALATNLVGFYGLTTELSPLLEQSQDPRVVNVVSAGMFTAKLHIPTIEKGLDAAKQKGEVEEEEPYSGIGLYAQHHRARVDLTDYFADKYKDAGIKVNCVHRKSNHQALSHTHKKKKLFFSD
jgi:dehydrogenase/reductase SDR family protein 12